MPAEPMCFREYSIHPSLAPFVKCIWSVESDGLVSDGRERILPDSCVELVFHFHDPYRTHFPDGQSALQPRSFVVGQMKRFLEIEPVGRAGCVAVRFHARGAYLFFQRPLREVAAGVVDLADVWRDRAREWTERIALANGMAARVRFIERGLLSRLARNGRTEPAVDRALEIIEATHGNVRVDDLAAEIGVSGRDLRRRFDRAVGLSPKEFGRITRFRHAVQTLSARGPRSLTDVALDCGFFDQAHFNHEFRALAGMSPSDLSTFPNVSV
jgi:AraC-like DNA-binding protein